MIVVLLLLVINLVFCVLVGNYASERGRSMLLWFLLAFITTPILAFILLLILGENESSQSYYPQDDYSPSYNRTPSYSGSTNYTKSKELKKPEIKKLSGKEFFEKVSRDYKLYKNDIIDLEKKETNYQEVVKDLKSSHLEGSFEEFMHEIIDLLEENNESNEEFDNIKTLVSSKFELQDLKTSDLVEKYNETKDELTKDELTLRGISLDFIESNPDFLDSSDYELLSKYIESKDSAVKEILDNKNIYDDDYISKVRGIKKLNNNQLILRYLEAGEESVYGDELRYREITTSAKELIKEIDKFSLINLYKDTGSAIARDELINRNLTEYLN